MPSDRHRLQGAPCHRNVAHKQGTVEFGAARRELKRVIEKAGMNSTDLERLDPPAIRSKLEGVKAPAVAGGGEPDCSAPEESRCFLQVSEQGAALQMLSCPDVNGYPCLAIGA